MGIVYAHFYCHPVYIKYLLVQSIETAIYDIYTEIQSLKHSEDALITETYMETESSLLALCVPRSRPPHPCIYRQGSGPVPASL